MNPNALLFASWALGLDKSVNTIQVLYKARLIKPNEYSSGYVPTEEGLKLADEILILLQEEFN